jgi:hypothetical protein
VYLRGGASGVAEGAATIGAGVEPGRGGPRRGRVGVGGGEEARGVAADAHGRGEAATAGREAAVVAAVGSGAGGHTRTRRGAERVGEFLERFPSWPSGGRGIFWSWLSLAFGLAPFAFFCAVLSVNCVVYFAFRF